MTRSSGSLLGVSLTKPFPPTCAAAFSVLQLCTPVCKSMCKSMYVAVTSMYADTAHAWMQATARLACAGLGFTSGFFQFGDPDTQAAPLPPPWIGVASCNDDDTVLADCARATFGDTAACGVTVELFCSNAAASARPGHACTMAQKGNCQEP